jgi:transposase
VRPKIDPHLAWIRAILASDKAVPRKQRHTAKRIFDRLVREHHYQGGYTAVKEVVREILRTTQEVFMPLAHRPGEAQVDFFEALANIAGTLRKVHVFVMALPYSDMFFCMAFPRECSEAFWEGHVQAFHFLGGVPPRISYDNLRIAVKAITGCHQRQLTEGFLRLQSHYLFQSHFCTVRRANEKGVVEGLARYARGNFLVPVPQVKEFNELNEDLRLHCWNEQFRTLRGKSQSKQQLWQEESKTFLALPATPFDISRTLPIRANSTSLVRFDTNDYSVPVRYAHQPLIVKGYIHHLWVYTLAGEAVARHQRCWEKHQISYDPRHYLPLLADKPGALDYAGPLADLTLPEVFDLLRRRLESEYPEKHQGTKEYIAVLRLLGRYAIARVAQAIAKALRYRRPHRDVILSYCLNQECPETLTFSLAGREHLAGVTAAPPQLESYGALLRQEVAV